MGHFWAGLPFTVYKPYYSLSLLGGIWKFTVYLPPPPTRPKGGSKWMGEFSRAVWLGGWVLGQIQEPPQRPPVPLLCGPALLEIRPSLFVLVWHSGGGGGGPLVSTQPQP